MDNSYALYYGDEIQATNFIGNDYNWMNTEVYTFTMPSYRYLYVVTESDLSVAQGFLAEFTNLDNNTVFHSNDPEWKVAATGRRGKAPYSNTPEAFEELNG